MSAVAKIAKRGTDEYAVRLYQKIPARLAKNYDVVSAVAKFCFRRLASEGLLPKPPQTSGLELFVSYPRPVFRRRRHLRNKVLFGRKRRRGPSKDKFRRRKKAAHTPAKLAKRKHATDNKMRC